MEFPKLLFIVDIIYEIADFLVIETCKLHYLIGHSDLSIFNLFYLESLIHANISIHRVSISRLEFLVKKHSILVNDLPDEFLLLE